LDDEWALVATGADRLSNYLALVKAMGSEQNLRAWTQITEALATIELDERGTPGHDAFVNYARSLIKPLATQLGWDAKADESPGIQRLRRSVISDLGAWGDQEVIAEARKRFAHFVADRSTVMPDDQAMILTIIAKNASEADFEQLHTIAKASKNETEQRRYYGALMAVRDSALANQAVGIALSDEIQKQADAQRLGFVIGLTNEHPELAWTTFTKNIDQIMASHQNFRTFFLGQSVPEIFWNAVPPDQLEAWVKSQVPAEMAPNIARGMETAKFKVAEKTLLVKSADDFIKGQKS
jgi:aminopeptidase N